MFIKTINFKNCIDAIKICEREYESVEINGKVFPGDLVYFIYYYVGCYY